LGFAYFPSASRHRSLCCDFDGMLGAGAFAGSFPKRLQW
jgi:hypothetical protein